MLSGHQRSFYHAVERLRLASRLPSCSLSHSGGASWPCYATAGQTPPSPSHVERYAPWGRPEPGSMKDSAGRNELCGSGAKTKRYCGGY